jgi:hypothetical protein
LNEIRKIIPESRLIHGRSDLPTAAGIFGGGDSPVLWDVRSLWSDQRKLIATPGWNALTTRGARSLENFSAKRATAITTLTSSIVPILEKRHSRLPEIQSVIPTCVQTSTFTPKPMPKGDLVCLLSGTFNNFYDILQTRYLIESIRSTTKLKVIWARPAETHAKTLGVGEDEILEASYAQMPNIISQAHFGIALLKESHGESLAASVPTKIAEFLSSGRPMILSKGIGDMDDLLREYNSGVIYSKNHKSSGISEEITTLVNDPDIINRCRSLAIDHFDMGTAIKKYCNVYSRMLGSNYE